jgi:dolichol-phosphate mannosyltransferase
MLTDPGISMADIDASQTYLLPAELSIIVPTFNESKNVAILAQMVADALSGVHWEMIFVDDNSPDGTSEAVRQMALADPRIRVIHRHNRRGLATACIEGILASAAPYVAVMDSDLQHDEKILGAMLGRIKQGDVDLVVGSRYTEGGGLGDWDRKRVIASKVATRLATKLTRTPISDPMSGFFMVRRDAFLRSLPNLSSIGFKILLDIAASAPEPMRVAEVPYTFRTRQHGESKLDSLVLWEYLQLILDKAFGRYIPARFMSFALVGGFGVFVHFTILTIMFKLAGASFGESQTVASIIAISNNFFLNNALTYRDQRLKGRALFFGWISFNLVCATGAAANIGVADWLFGRHTYWVFSAIAGVLVSVVWNYAMSSLFTWRRR